MIACLLLASWAVAAQAEPLSETLSGLLEANKKIRAASSDMKAAEEQAKEAWGAWYPQLDTTADYGYERTAKPSLTNTAHLHPGGVTVKATQLLWDFGGTNAAVRKSELAAEGGKANLDAVQQDVLLEGLTAYLNLAKNARALDYARQSVDNIRKQTGMEEARVDMGPGYPTDVLQSKSQLAGAEARLARAEGAFIVSVNRYRAVFGQVPADLANLAIPTLDQAGIPPTVEEATRIAEAENPQIKSAGLIAASSREEVTRVLAAKALPKVNAIASAANLRDVSGTAGDEHDTSVKVQVTYPLNLGLTAVNSLRAAEYGVSGAENRLGDTGDRVEEAVRNAWQNLLTARLNLQYLQTPANIAEKFLELARKERLQGRRSLIDVLSGETTLINARSDAAAAQADVAIAQATLLATLGRLSPAVVK
ncbi:MAG: TolC family outer membrane protein [Actinomycetota bacterium]